MTNNEHINDAIEATAVSSGGMFVLMTDVTLFLKLLVAAATLYYIGRKIYLSHKK